MSVPKFLSDIHRSIPVIPPADEQTTMRLTKTLREKLRVIAAMENTTMMGLTEAVLSHYCAQYEAASGKSIEVRNRVRRG